MSDSADCGSWFACAKTARPAWLRMFDFVMFADSEATSTSRMREFAADRFSCALLRFETVTCIRFCVAPTFARADESCVIALSNTVIAFCALVTVERLADATWSEVEPSVDVVSFVMLIARRSLLELR